MVKKKERYYFKELKSFFYHWNHTDTPTIGLGGLSAVGVWFPSIFTAYFIKNIFEIKFHLYYIFIPVYLILFSLFYFQIEKKWRETLLVRSFLYSAIFLALLLLILSLIFYYLGINIESLFNQFLFSK